MGGGEQIFLFCSHEYLESSEAAFLSLRAVGRVRAAAEAEREPAVGQAGDRAEGGADH
jgi:hypothetical protein